MKLIKVVVSKIISHKALGAKTFVLSSKDGKELPEFRAGQYIAVKMQIGRSYISRPYSICSSPMDALMGKYAITVQANPGGFAADWMLENLKEGSELSITYPQGDFYPVDTRRDVIALAGGSGVTPFLSMAYAIRDGVENFNLTIIYGNPNEKDILFKKELDELCKETDKVKVVYTEFVDHSLVSQHAKNKYCIMVCGPRAMYEFLGEDLKKLNLPKKYIRTEMLPVTKDPLGIEEKRYKIQVRIGLEVYNFKASSREPLLVGMERYGNGIMPQSCCRSGVCGWCKSRVLEGTYYVPEENDKRGFFEKNYDKRIHPCVTFPTSDMIIEVPYEHEKRVYR